MISRRDFIEGTGALSATKLINPANVRPFVTTEQSPVQRSFIHSVMLTKQSDSTGGLFAKMSIIVDDDQVMTTVGIETIIFTDPAVQEAFRTISNLGIEHSEDWTKDEA